MWLRGKFQHINCNTDNDSNLVAKILPHFPNHSLVQSIKQNFFQFFGLSESYDVDLDRLEVKYYELQKKFHPDKSSPVAEKEKIHAVQLTSFINDAYDTLKSPLKRAAYVLTIQGYDVEKVSQDDLSMDLLVEQMQLRESLDELPKDDSALPGLEKLKKDVKEKLVTRELSFAGDVSSQNFLGAKKTFHELQFLNKLVLEIEENEEQRMDY